MSDFDYQRYLASREWALKKQAVRERCHGRCERCVLGDYQNTHHVTYAHLGNEPLEDLLAVCRPCHRYLSGLSEVDPAADIEIMPALRASEEDDEAFHVVALSGETRALFDNARPGDLGTMNYMPKMGWLLVGCIEPCGLCVVASIEEQVVA